MKILAFRVWGPYAHFRRVYTTTSASTYSFPPRTAIIGLIGAILGIPSKPRAFHLRELKDLRVAVALEKSVDKTRIPVNLVSIKDDRKRIQIPLEIIKDPVYKVYVSDENFEKFEMLERLLKYRETMYTPYLGISEFIASFEYLGTYQANVASTPTNVVSVVRTSLAEIAFEKGCLYLTERTTREMDENRKYVSYETYILSAEAKPIKLKNAEVELFKVGDEVIMWL